MTHRSIWISALAIVGCLVATSVSAQVSEGTPTVQQPAKEQGKASMPPNPAYEEAVRLWQGDEEKEIKRAVKTFRKLAEQGHAGAQFYLGLSYDIGEGIAKNQCTAIIWYRKAADQGHADAQNNLGVDYDDGICLKKDQVKAVELFRKSADQGNSDAQYNLGVAYSEGDGVEKDLVKAAEWYRKSAEQGDSDAQFELGVAYLNGDGVKRDVVFARMLLLLAAAASEDEPSDDLTEQLNKSASQLTPEQTAEAEALAKAWKSGTPLPNR